VEYACMFATLGVRVIIVEKRPRLLRFADAEVVEALSYHIRDRRATMRCTMPSAARAMWTG
jgi:NAD(P) transhydrogenase